MTKRKAFILYCVVAIVIICFLHFIPVSREHGVLDTTTCIGYTSPQVHPHRVIFGGLNSYNEERERLKISDANSACGKPVDLHLYLW